MKENPIIKIDKVNFTYDIGTPQEFQALKNVDLEIDRGDYVAFFGPSGCGKSTLLYLIAGVEAPSAGKVFISNQDITNLNQKDLAIYRQSGVGIIFQNFNLIPSISVLENVAMPMSFMGVDGEERTKRAMEVLKRLDIDKFFKRYPQELSGGQQQRVSIARALVNNPPIMLADEPLGNLDSENAQNVLNFLKELNQKDKQTIIMVTHEAWSLRDANKIFHMKDGVVFKVEDRGRSLSGTGSREGGEQEPPAVEARSRSISHLLLRGFSSQEIERLEILLTSLLRGEIKIQNFIENLDKPFREGGVGLWKQRAKKIGELVQREMEETKDLEKIYKKLHSNPEAPLWEEVNQMAGWLVEDLRTNFNSLQVEQIGELVEERIRGIITAEDFLKVITMSKKEGGVGLNVRAGLRVVEKMESLLSGEQITPA